MAPAASSLLRIVDGWLVGGGGRSCCPGHICFWRFPQCGQAGYLLRRDRPRNGHCRLGARLHELARLVACSGRCGSCELVRYLRFRDRRTSSTFFPWAPTTTSTRLHGRLAIRAGVAGGRCSAELPPRARPCSAFSRGPDKLDIFCVGTDRRVYTAVWEAGDTSWQGWWSIGVLTVAPNTSVFAVSRSLDHLDIFAIGEDSRIYTAAWAPGMTRWRGWWCILEGMAAPGTTVSAVVRSADHLDVFAVGTDSHIYTAAWQP